MSNVACSFPGCERAVYCRGICAAHYRQKERGEELHPTKAMLPTVCRVDGCDGRVFTKSRQLCKSHYDKWKRGTLDPPLVRPCLNCGTNFNPIRRKNAECCSKRCGEETARLRNLYGLTGADVNAMLVTQAHGCAICRAPIARGGKLHIDHCHNTGRVRGLLCLPCNWGLGRFRDDPSLLRAAAKYLEI